MLQSTCLWPSTPPTPELFFYDSYAAAEPGKPHPSSTEIELGLLAPYHQHILCARLDLDIDGENNSVIELDSFAHPLGEKNPYGGAYEVQETVLNTEEMGQ